MSDDLLERLVDWDEYDEGKLNDMREEAKARIEALTAERDGLLRCVTDNHVALCRAEKAEAERDRLTAIGTEMAASIEGNYYLPGVVRRWFIALSGESDE